jgi:hypothetical protein
VRHDLASIGGQWIRHAACRPASSQTDGGATLPEQQRHQAERREPHWWGRREQCRAQRRGSRQHGDQAGQLE